MELIEANFPDHFVKLAKEIFSLGPNCRLYVVGGAVRDYFLGIKPEDIDFMVTGFSTIRNLKHCIEALDFGAAYSTTIDGNNMPVLRIRSTEFGEFDGEEIALARTERSVDFSSYADVQFQFQNITVSQDLQRRDITWNAMAVDVITEEIYDPFGGRKDIENNVIAAVDLDLFKTSIERPLRVGTMLARFGDDNTIVDPNLVSVCTLMSEHVNFHLTSVPHTGRIPYSQVGNQIKKALLGERFDLFWSWMETCDWLRLFEKLFALSECPQDPRHHPEGNVWVHTLEVIKEAQTLVNFYPDFTDGQRKEILLGALCHDISKPNYTILVDSDDNTVDDSYTSIHRKFVKNEIDFSKYMIKSPGHAEGFTAFDFLTRFNITVETSNLVGQLVSCHMDNLNFKEGFKPSKRQCSRLLNRLYPSTLEQLYILMQADNLGRPGKARIVPANVQVMYDNCKSIKLDDNTGKPYCPVLGRHLIAWGLNVREQGRIIPYFGSLERSDTIIGYLYILQLEGYFGDFNAPDARQVESFVKSANWRRLHDLLSAEVPAENIEPDSLLVDTYVDEGGGVWA